MTVFLTRGDRLTEDVVRFFARHCGGTSIAVRRWRLHKYELMCREIGRNQAALATSADWIWFTDCDYCFGPAALDTAAELLSAFSGPLAYPRETLISATAAKGDETIQRLTSIPCLIQFDSADFVRSANDCAIGGIQIVRGDVAREIGYLNGSKHLRRSRSWRRTFGDVRFRQTIGTAGTPLEIPNLYRILHTKAGRDYPDLCL